LSDLRSHLNYQPVELSFGTSGRRGKVIDLTQLEIYINVTAELNYLLSLRRSDGGIEKGDIFYFAHDLRPSSATICQAVQRAVRDAGLQPVNLGDIPTPALAFNALAHKRGSIMVTGSHIPFDLNGYKLNTSTGELSKEQEAPISQEVRIVREHILNEPLETSPFDATGAFRMPIEPAPIDPCARSNYIDRYLNFFKGRLDNRRILVYQHSAVGRDLLAELLRSLGADVIAAGCSESFVAIDTEAIDAAQLSTIQTLADEVSKQHGSLWAVVSTDGDSDRPLILGVDNARVHFFPGDLVGMITAQYLNADAVVVPISCNDGIDHGSLAQVLEPKTKIGSPHVIAGMAAARAKGRKTVCGWEANGGFLLGSDVIRGDRQLTALPTRDAVLPVLAVLFAAGERGGSLAELFSTLPKRYSRSALLRNFPRQNGRRIVQLLTRTQAHAVSVTRELEQLFSASNGFSTIANIDYTDGVRLYFTNGEIAHFRPSGNADEFRIYAVADSQERAEAIVAAGIAEPDGIIRAMERLLLKD
jgi:phosphomannomutase